MTDVDLWEDHQLPLAAPEAYPYLVRYRANHRISRAGVAELEFVGQLLEALAQTTEAEIDTGRWHKEIPAVAGAIRMTLALPDLLQPPTPQQWLKRGFAPDRRALERAFADMDRYFALHPPESLEEMDSITSRLFSGRRMDVLVTPPVTALERAQDLCYQAFDTHGRRQVQIARQALELSPDCADAYVILAERAGTAEARLDLYRQGVAAGERALGPDFFQENAGDFWQIISTRPYMRSRLGLAQSLEKSGRLEEAVGHYQELLRLNPNDNQGVRHLLIPQLLTLGRDADAARLLKEYPEKTTNWAYAQALLAFRLSGPSAAAKKELRQALRLNPYVLEFLLGDESPPPAVAYRLGSVEEAAFCADELKPAFASAQGALAWLASEQQPKPSSRGKRTAGRDKRKKR